MFVSSHAEVQGLPASQVLDDLAAFQLTLFSNPRLRDLVPPGIPPPPVASTDRVHFDRRPLPSERGALLAYLRKQ